ncbi:MAG TPA: lytic transglycosylase domain-containing protein [Thermoanaerobaculia bacterium]|nr:lytic transglycosylase domain-containing protein [Thermoanaerobaculia bacterium]
MICPCQHHRHSRRGVNGGRRLLLLAGPIVLLGIGLPLDAFEAGLAGSRAEAGQTMGAVLPGEIAEMIRSEVTGAIPFAETASISLGNPVALPNPLLIESVREQFFRTSVPFGEIIYREAKREGLAPELVAAVVQTESDFRPRLVSPKDARGLMQLLPSTAALMGVRNVYDPVENIRGGTRYLKYLHGQFDDPVMVLAAYNAGPTRVRTFGGIPPFRETREYVVKVDRNTRRYQKEVATRLAELGR